MRPREPKRPGVEPFAARLLAGVPRWRFGERRIARQLAEQHADGTHQLALEAHQAALAVHDEQIAAHQRDVARLERERETEGRLLQMVHERLLAGDVAATSRAITAALEDLPVQAELVGWHQGAALVAVAAPTIDTVPERAPDWTASGKPTTRKLSQTQRNELHADAVAAVTIAAARRAQIAAPAVPSVVCAALDNRRAILAHCRVSRAGDRPSEDAVIALYDLDGQLEETGRTRKLAAVDIDGRPELRALEQAARAARLGRR